mmetsp:Transcript_18860/g.27891  ORF Transcript_18860/g.27891 Transcript_18860/m.27891 type:complete len:240 (-) Transcript_18860:292-1011(-)
MANVVAEVKRINELELEKGIVGTSASWHAKYEKSAWVYVGNLPTNLTEGDVICIMSQFGEIEDLNLVREESTGKSRGFCFCKYEDARSCILAVDNFCGQKVLGRPLRVDHCENYRLPKEILEKEEGQKLQTEGARTDPGHAYHGKELASKYSINEGHDLFSKPCDIDKQELSKGGQKLLKRKPKEDRHRRRKEREERRAAKEEKRRKKRARERQSMVDDESELFGSRSRGHQKRRKRDE